MAIDNGHKTLKTRSLYIGEIFGKLLLLLQLVVKFRTFLDLNGGPQMNHLVYF